MATRGRPPRKRSPKAGTAVRVGGHTRSPRGPNSNKPAVVVSGYSRGKPGKRKTRNKARKRSN